MNISESQLATALEGFVLGVRPLGAAGTGDPITAQVDDADDFAKALFVTLARMTALDEDEPERCPECADPELAAMAALLPALPEVRSLDPYTRDRVMDWARRRACDGAPPF